tara:strand:- start:359 stop:577 length:219 start_codon:yes stop_codon:yes gene_type:complete
MVEIGDIIKMTKDLKEGLIENGSKDHVEEFGDCEGVVESWVYPDSDEKDVNVRWKPSNLRYAYGIDMLTNVL